MILKFKVKRHFILVTLLVTAGLFCRVSSASGKTRIMIVSSYHKEYLWSQDTHAGVCAALLRFKYLDNSEQVKTFTDKDLVFSSRSVIKKVWMDTKRKASKAQIARATLRTLKAIEKFKPDIILLGDDNATNHIGNQYIDTDIPVVFWGVNGRPGKYGLINSVKRPGHNITGIYQAGYFKECLAYLKKLKPEIKTFAILSDDSPTGRSNAKAIEKLARAKKLPLKLVKSVTTNRVEEWKREALRLSKKVDAFFILNHNTLKSKGGRHIRQLDLGAWYLRNIKIPECSHEKQFVKEGMLLAADDSGTKQGYEAVRTADIILGGIKNPGDIPARAPKRGPIVVNRVRAEMLGISLQDKGFIEEYIEEALALSTRPARVVKENPDTGAWDLPEKRDDKTAGVQTKKTAPLNSAEPTVQKEPRETGAGEPVKE